MPTNGASTGDTPYLISRRNLLTGVGATTALYACGSQSTSKLGVAVVGLGSLALGQILPALRQTGRCRLAGLISSDPDKMRAVGTQYGVPTRAHFTYDNLEKIAEHPEIDFVYIAVPNALHADFAVRSAKAGKHVFCEKPMAVSVEQCRTMIAACKAADRYLATAYRLQFAPHYREIIRLARETAFGPVRIIQAEIGFPLAPGATWPLKRDLAGGGALMEMGIYAIQAARHLTGEEPAEVVGLSNTNDQARFSEVEESALWTMVFPSGVIAHCAASYGTVMDRLRVNAADGHFALEPAYSFTGLRGVTSKGPIERPELNQFAAELDEFARCIQENVPPTRGSGEESLRDVQLIQTVYASIAERKHISVAPSGERHWF